MIRMSKLSIRYKLFAGVLLTTISALLISGVAMIVYDLQDYHERLIRDLKTQGSLFGLANAPALQFNDPQIAADSLALLKARPQIIAAAIYNAKGNLFATYSSAEYDSKNFPSIPESEGEHLEGQSLIVSQRIIDHNEILGTIYIRAHYQLYDRVWQYAGIVCAVTVLALIISMLLSLWMQAKVTRPILGISELARKITEQKNYSLRAEKSSDDEIGYLVDAFNNLLAEVGERSTELETSNRQLQQQIHERHRAAEEIQRLNAELEQRVEERTAELERANKELEAFSYSVSHDLRTPLRAIDGFSQALLEDYAERLDETGRDYLARVRSGAQRMGRLIDDMLKLARVSRATLNQEPIDLSALAEEIVSDLHASDSKRHIDIKITSGMTAIGDSHLLRIALENLLNNAWKYTGKRERASIEFGMRSHDGEACYFVEDNGAGFDMTYADKLFGAFQRLHDAKEYPGTGIGLATVQRIIHRHSGHIWAEGAVNKGSAFYFTLPLKRVPYDEHATDIASRRQSG